MTKTSNKRDDEKERDLMRSAQESPDAGDSVDWTAIREKVLCRAKKSPLGRRAGDLLSNGWLHTTLANVKSL
jgi:hypothetical protein